MKFLKQNKIQSILFALIVITAIVGVLLPQVDTKPKYGATGDPVYEGVTAGNLTTTDLDAPTGRNGTFTLVSDVGSSALEQSQGDQVLTGTSMETIINSTLVTLEALAGRPKLKLIGTFACDGQIVSQSNVDVELQGEIDINTNSVVDGILFQTISNSIWSGGTIKRQGTVANTGSSCVMIFLDGGSNVIIKDMQVISEIVGGGEASSAIRCLDNTQFINVIARASLTGTNDQNCGFLIGGAWTEAGFGILTTHLINCIGYAGGGNFSAGILIQSALTDKVIFDNCTGYGINTATGTYSHGIVCWDGGSPVLNNCIGYGGGADGTGTLGYGLWIDGGSSRPNVNNGVYYGGIGNNNSNRAVVISNASAPTLNGVTGMPQQYSARHYFDAAATGFKPFADKAYTLISMYVGLNHQIAGVTLDIGTTVGGHELGEDIPLDGGGSWVSFDLTRYYFAANELMYLTPSGAIPAPGPFPSDLFVNYTVAYDSGGDQSGLVISTKGAASINGCTFLAGRNGFSVSVQPDSYTVKDWSINNSLLQNYNEHGQWDADYALYSVTETMVNMPIYNSRIGGKVRGVISFADYSNSFISVNYVNPNLALTFKKTMVEHFQDVLVASATAIRSGEDLSAGLPLTFTLDAQPDIPRVFTWILTHTNITAYTITFTGTDAKGRTVTDVITAASGWSGTTANAYAKITSIIMSVRTGTGAGDTMDIGTGSKIGLSNHIPIAGALFKAKQNNADLVLTKAVAEATYDTVDFAAGGGSIGAADDLTVWYKY